MNRLALAALVAGSMAGISGPALALRGRTADVGPMPIPAFGGGGSAGKGKGKHPHHSSARFVAQDKRDARKRRNRNRR